MIVHTMKKKEVSADCSDDGYVGDAGDVYITKFCFPTSVYLRKKSG